MEIKTNGNLGFEFSFFQLMKGNLPSEFLLACAAEIPTATCIFDNHPL